MHAATDFTGIRPAGWIWDSDLSGPIPRSASDVTELPDRSSDSPALRRFQVDQLSTADQLSGLDLRSGVSTDGDLVSALSRDGLRFRHASKCQPVRLAAGC